jgi:hypothetical protein
MTKFVCFKSSSCSAENTKYWLSIPTEACIERYFEEENNEKSCYPSANMTITGYSDSRYCTELRCSIDSLPTYCSGSPVTLSRLPPGEHVLTIIEPLHDEIRIESFGWDIS